MKKQLTTLTVLAGFALMVAFPAQSFAATGSVAAPIPAPAKNGIEKNCNNSKKSLGLFVNIVQLDQSNYYLPVSQENLAKYYKTVPAKALDNKTEIKDVHSTKAQVPHYNNAGKIVTTGSPRTNYQLVVTSNTSTLAYAKALGKGIETRPSYVAYDMAIKKLQFDVNGANAEIKGVTDKWNVAASPAALAALDCATVAGRDAVLALRTQRATDLKMLHGSLKLVKEDSAKLAVAQKKLSGTYQSLNKKK